MWQFMVENCFFEIHQKISQREWNGRENTYKNSKKQIDAAIGTGLIVCIIRGSRSINLDEIVVTNHRGFLFDIDFKEIFKLQASHYN